MYCRNCGNEMNNEAVVCVGCGVPVGKGNHFCPNCGEETNPEAVVCVKCGVPLSAPVEETSEKSKIVAGLLGIFLGCWGVHNFYLGYKTKAIIQLLLGTIGILPCGLGIVASSIWGLVEGIMVLCGNIAVDGKGKKLKD